MKEHKKRFRIEFTVDVLNEGFNTEDWDWSNESIKSFALQELMCMSPFPEDITFSEVENNWHTGTPTEDGDYFVAYHWGLDNKIMHDMAIRILYGATTFKNGNWKMDYPYVVIAWQKIEPYKEEKEDGKCSN